jgi:hypothetical protein
MSSLWDAVFVQVLDRTGSLMPNLSGTPYTNACGLMRREVTLPSLSPIQTLRQLMHVILICIPNNKTSKKRNTRKNSQTFGKGTCLGCQRTVSQATIDKSMPSTPPLRSNESQFELVSSTSVPQVCLDKTLRTIIR